jgi:hypothetical protein
MALDLDELMMANKWLSNGPMFLSAFRTDELLRISSDQPEATGRVVRSIEQEIFASKTSTVRIR